MPDKPASTPTPGCPGVERLLAGIDRADPEITRHAGSCAFCSGELRLFESFRRAEVADSDARAVNAITARLKSRAGEILPVPLVAAPWWKSLFTTGWGGSAMVAIGASALLVMIAIELRPTHPPALNTKQSGAEVFRSPEIVSIVSPSGDVAKPPASIVWMSTPGAASYRVRVTEVDGHELWSAVTSDSSATLPADIQAKIVPSKTLLLDVRAFDAAGRKMAASETTRFRFLQPFYRP
jgi:hypothetical protein